MTNTASPTIRYTNFYLIMLILTSISLGLSVIGVLLSMSDFSRSFSFAPAYTICQIVGAVLTVLAIPVLVLLWRKKNPLGIYLMLAVYVAITLTSIATVFFLEPMLQDTITYSIKESPDLPANDLATILRVTLYGANIFMIVANIAMGTLWWFAYKHQKKADSNQPLVSSKVMSDPSD